MLAPAGSGYSLTPNPTGLGKYGDRLPMSWKMLAFVVSPTIGREVSRGVLGTKDLDAPKGAGLVSARNGALPVAVGP